MKNSIRKGIMRKVKKRKKKKQTMKGGIFEE